MVDSIALNFSQTKAVEITAPSQIIVREPRSKTPILHHLYTFKNNYNYLFDFELAETSKLRSSVCFVPSDLKFVANNVKETEY